MNTAFVLLRRLGVSAQFLRFAVVGTQGFCWDTATVYALRPVVGLYGALVAGFFVAATANWLLNRVWTFRTHFHEAPHVQWARFVAANSLGFVFNMGCRLTVTATNETFRHQPVLAVAAGSLCGLIFNYFLSKRYVFR